MNVLGIVAEYNPFHNGHKFHIETSKKVSGSSHTVCVMSGSLVQRGEFAIYNKWERAKMAILGGADLVLELPAYYVLQSAENFAYGAVKLLNSLNIVDNISFGSEISDLTKLQQIADVFSEENDKFNEIFKNEISSGNSYAVSKNIALNAVLNDCDEILTPNNLLGIYYLKAIKKLKSNLNPIAIKRHLTLHNDIDVNENFATASHIRSEIFSNTDYKIIEKFLPGDYSNCEVFDEKNIADYILGFFRFNDISDNILGAENGLINNIKHSAKNSTNLDEFYDNCTSRRYTKSRIKRVCKCAMLGINEEKNMDYIRVLGFNDKGRELIKVINEKAQIPVVVKTANFKPSKNSSFEYDIKATDLASFSLENKKFGLDYKTSPIIIR